MPPTVAGWRAMYSRDPVTGELYGIGVPPPPSPFIADGVEPAPLPVDFIWGDTSQVTPVGAGAFSLDQISDVDTSTVAPVNGDTLVWDATALPAPGQWKPVASSAPVPSVTYPVVYEASWSGSMQFRVNAFSVTLQMDAVKSSSVWTGAPSSLIKICAIPAGVPAPFVTLTTQVMLVTDPVALNLSTRPVMVQAKADGIYMQLYAGAAAFDTVANDLIYCTLSWTV